MDSNIEQRILFTEDLHNRYKRKAREYAKLWNVNNEHVIQLMLSVMLDRDGLMEGGSFVKAVNRNDLQDAVNRADTTSMSYLKVLVATKYNCHVLQEVF